MSLDETMERLKKAHQTNIEKSEYLAALRVTEAVGKICEENEFKCKCFTEAKRVAESYNIPL